MHCTITEHNEDNQNLQATPYSLYKHIFLIVDLFFYFYDYSLIEVKEIKWSTTKWISMIARYQNKY